MKWVVGSAFESSTRHDNIVTLEEVLDGQCDGEHLAPGQGVSAADWEYLAEVGKVSLADPPGVPAHRQLVVKHGQDNVVITRPMSLGGDRYQAELLIPNRTEIMADHTAEQQHIPGMLLVEAAIQVITAVVADFLGRDRYAVMHALRFEFQRFVFPLPTTIELHLTQTGEARPDRIPLHAEVTFLQAGRVATTAGFNLHAFDPVVVGAVEHGQAIGVLKALEADDVA